MAKHGLKGFAAAGSGNLLTLSTDRGPVSLRGRSRWLRLGRSNDGYEAAHACLGHGRLNRLGRLYGIAQRWRNAEVAGGVGALHGCLSG
ncbi:hypothetical protein ASF56_23445 [Methylobacterium sp. Leaf122]|uniref:Uncharacterized protein n=1 Tax=Methylorubrum extorquens TaxID=408 RepID=A0A1S1PB21_METEX|nr:hypothetical protein ASF33_17040 [Methylobacterium sp. Leaf92]KQQ15957.1 hypothetical protein ASF56_23445 [Methylobacterium sp. Leaf122]OHV17812.1 hypothetical protein BK022_03380 [Methylorubrum extorquens]